MSSLNLLQMISKALGHQLLNLIDTFIAITNDIKALGYDLYGNLLNLPLGIDE